MASFNPLVAESLPSIGTKIFEHMIAPSLHAKACEPQCVGDTEVLETAESYR
jgi:hypothetical protein